jgi:hypothetical protein
MTGTDADATRGFACTTVIGCVGLTLTPTAATPIATSFARRTV